MRLLVMMGLLLAMTVSSAAFDDLPSFPGSVAVIGNDYNVYTISATRTAQLTTDGGPGTAYQWPTWARDGRLAFFCCDLSNSTTFRTGVFISADGIQTPRSVVSSFGQPIIYASWSPAACNGDTACRDLSVLVNDLSDNSLRVQLIRDTGTDRSISDVGFGSPFYSSFSPDGSAMLLHRENSIVEVYDINTSSSQRVLEGRSSGTFQAAVWSPVDSSLLYGITADNGSTSLVINQNGIPRTIAEGINGLVAFEWSPDGTMIAYRTRTRDGLEPVTIVNARTGSVVTSGGENVFAFWWSPDSSKLALLTIPRDGANTAMVSSQPVQNAPNVRTRWEVMDAFNGQIETFSLFTPNFELAYLANYFDQFAVSHAMWSPDSRYIVYSETVGGTSNQVSLLDTQTGDFFKLADGRVGVWSW